MTQPAAVRLADRGLRLAEDAVYALSCFVLVVGALSLLAKAGYDLVTGMDDGVADTATGVLDTLLLVFILVELLSAVRATMTERRLVAEPFLLVGIIATVKEVVVTSISLKDKTGTDAFEDSAVEVAVLGGVLLLFAVASFLLRLKEREPREASS